MGYVAVMLSTICFVNQVELTSVPSTESATAHGNIIAITRITRHDAVCKDSTNVANSSDKYIIAGQRWKVFGVSADDCLEWCLRRLTCKVALTMRNQCCIRFTTVLLSNQ